MMNHVDDLIAAYALDALPADEMEVVETHLRSCSSCRREAAEAIAIADLIPLAADVVQPSPMLRARVLTAATSGGEWISSARRAPGTEGIDAAGIESAANRGRGETGTGPRSGTFEPRGVSQPAGWRARALAGRLLWPRFSLPPAVAAAAVAVVLVLGIAVGRLGNSPTLTSQQRYEQRIAQAVTNGDTVVAFRSAKPSLNAEAALVVPGTGRASVIVGHMSPPPAGKVYQVWFISNPSTPTSAGVFTLGATFPATARLAKAAGGYHLAAVTVEPGPAGSPRPTTPPLLSVSLSRV